MLEEGRAWVEVGGHGGEHGRIWGARQMVTQVCVPDSQWGQTNKTSQSAERGLSSAVHSLSHVQLFATPRTSTSQTSLSLPSDSMVKNPPAVQEMRVRSLDWEDPLEKKMSTWEIPWTEEPGGLQSMESQKSWTRLSGQTRTTCKETGVSRPEKPQGSRKSWAKHFLKARWGGWGLQGLWSASAQFSDGLMLREQDGVTGANVLSP